MDDIFYFSKQTVSYNDIAILAHAKGWERIKIAPKGLEIGHREDRLCNCHWRVFDMSDADPTEVYDLRAEGVVSAFCVSHHRQNRALIELLKEILETYGGWVGNDHDGFLPRFDLSNIEQFRYD